MPKLPAATAANRKTDTAALTATAEAIGAVGSLFQDNLADEDLLGIQELDSTLQTINLLYYGREGTGKTTNLADLVNTTGHPGRLLVINAEGGLKKQALAKRGIPADRIAIWPKPGVPITFASLEAVHAKLLADLQADPMSWAGVGFDSITELAALFRETATTARYRRLVAQNRDYDPTLIDRSDYGVQTDQLQRLLRRFRDLPCHFVVTALERFDEDTGLVGPAVNPALATALLGYVDFVLYCRSNPTQDEPEFRAATRPSTTYRAKDRFDVLPSVLANPTFSRVHAYVAGEITESEDPTQISYRERETARETERTAQLEAKKAARATRRSTTTKPITTDTKTGSNE